MTKNFIDVKYEIIFESPFHFGTGLPNGLIDRGVAKDADGYLYIPGSTIKGVLREKCEQIAQSFDLDEVIDPHDEEAALSGFNNISIVDRIFGTRFKPGEVYFENATMSKKWTAFFDEKGSKEGNSKRNNKPYIHLQTENRIQTSVSRVLGTVREKALYHSEFGIKKLSFEGSIYGYVEGIELLVGEGLYPVVLLMMALCSCQHLGSNKSTGIGRCSLNVTSLKVNSKKREVNDFIKHVNEFELYRELKGEELE